jgi:predicted PurR-regulated permease PerM
VQQNVKNGFFIFILILIVYLAGRVIWPFVSYLVLAAIIAYTLRPLYLLIEKLLHKPWLSSLIMVVLVLSVIVIPSFFIIKTLIEQSGQVLMNLRGGGLDTLSEHLSELLRTQVNLGELFGEGLLLMQNFLLRESLMVLGKITHIILGLLIMFFTLYYFFKDGHKVYEAITSALPLQQKHTKVLFGEIQLVTNAVIYGQLAAALVQATVAGIGFVIFGIPNPVFWAFMTALVAFLPVVGTPVVFIPLSIFELISGNFGSGLGILAYGLILIMNVDNLVKPFIISEKSQLNPAMMIIGMIGGLTSFGFMGFIIGPMILGLLVTLLNVFRKDFQPSEELKAVQEHNNQLVIPLFIRPPDKHRKL